MSKKEFKRLSYAERMANPDVICVCKKKVCDSDMYNVAVEEQEVVNGRIVKTRKFKKVDQNDYLSQFKVEDFCLENLQACGAVANLKPVTLDGGYINSIDNMLDSFNTLESLSIEEE